jgi:hypothetical protein
MTLPEAHGLRNVPPWTTTIVTKAIDNNEERKGNHSGEQKILTWKPSPIKRDKKPRRESVKLYYIGSVFTNTVGYLMMRLTLAGGLQGIYIGGGNDPLGRSLRRRASLRSSEVGLYFV